MSDNKNLVIRVAKESEAPRLAEMFVETCKDDRFYRALFREDEKYLSALYLYLKEWILYAIKHHQVFIAGDFVGGSIIMPPHYGRVSLGEQLSRLKSSVKIFSLRKLIPSLIELNSIISETPKKPHYYLFLIGHRPGSNFSHQGIASALVKRTLNECDRLQVPCYAEFTSQKSAEWGKKLGFKIFKEKSLLFHRDVIIKLAVREPIMHAV